MKLCAKKAGKSIPDQVAHEIKNRPRVPEEYSDGGKLFEIQGEFLDWQLKVVNPSLVIGPLLNPQRLSESMAIIRDVATGALPGARLGIGYCYIDDVSMAHIRLIEDPSTMGRHIISSESLYLRESVPSYSFFSPFYKLPGMVLPDWLVKFSSLFMPGVSYSQTSALIGRIPLFNHAKAESTLGFPLARIYDMLPQSLVSLAQHGIIPNYLPQVAEESQEPQESEKSIDETTPSATSVEESSSTQQTDETAPATD